MNNIRLLATVVNREDWPRSDLPEIALAGRSNVGKSSLINLILNRNRVAYVGKIPGKTRTANFFEVDGKFCFVDLPGYGYATGTKGMEEKWAEFVNSYFEERKQLKFVIHLLDSRHTPSVSDKVMNEWLKNTGIGYAVCLTKTDKLTAKERLESIGNIRESLEIPDGIKLIEASTIKRKGREELTDLIREHLNDQTGRFQRCHG
jgi:GTP-binding protein